MEGLHSPACEKHEANGSTKRGENNKETMKNEGKNEKRQRNSHARRARVVTSRDIQEQSGAGGQKGSTRSTTTTLCQNRAHAYTRAPFLIVPKSKNSVRVSRSQNRAYDARTLFSRETHNRARNPYDGHLERAGSNGRPGGRGLGIWYPLSPCPLCVVHAVFQRPYLTCISHYLPSPRRPRGAADFPCLRQLPPPP